MMKKLFTMAVMLLMSMGIYAQNMKKETIKYTDTRLPLQPLPTEITHYQFEVITPYPANNDDVKEFARQKYEDDKAAHPQKVEEAKRQYEQDLANYDVDVEIARENFRLENEAYQSLSTLERLAQSDNKPVLKLPSKPYLRIPSEPVYREPDLSKSIVYQPEALANTLSLDGYEKGSESALTATITLYSFEYLDPVRKSEEKKVYNTKPNKRLQKPPITMKRSTKDPFISN